MVAQYCLHSGQKHLKKIVYVLFFLCTLDQNAGNIMTNTEHALFFPNALDPAQALSAFRCRRTHCGQGDVTTMRSKYVPATERSGTLSTWYEQVLKTHK